MVIPRCSTMPPEPSPRLADAISQTLAAALTRSGDRWLRAALPPDWPLPEALDQLLREFGHGDLHVGLLRPHSAGEHTAASYTMSDSPATITRWRNRKAKRAPTVVL